MDASCLWDVLDAETTFLDETKLVTEYQPDGSLYQLVTCVRVTPRTGSGHVNHVALCSSSDVIVVAAENQLMLFRVADRQLFSSLGFESMVDCVKCSGDGLLLVIGERSGAMHAIDTKTGDQLISQRLGLSAGNDDTPFFRTVEFGPGPHGRLAVLTGDGHVLVVDGFSTGQVRHTVIDSVETTLCLAVMSSGDIVTSDAEDTLNLWSVIDGSFSLTCSCPMLSGPAVKCAALHCDDYVLVLDSAGHLVLWNVHRFVAVSRLGCSDVADFTLVDRPMDSALCVGTIVILHNSETSSRVSIYSLPCTELIYSIEVHQGALLFPSSGLNDSVYLLEAWCDSVSGRPADAASGWQVRRLAETDPQTQLRRLLAKQRFTEAESFAEKFGLDVQFVYLECVATLLLTSVDDAGQPTSQLVRCLSRLDGVAFVVDCCVTTALPELSSTNQLLNLARQRLDGSRNLSAEHQASLSNVLEQTTRRLAAFQVPHFHFCY